MGVLCRLAPNASDPPASCTTSDSSYVFFIRNEVETGLFWHINVPFLFLHRAAFLTHVSSCVWGTLASVPFCTDLYLSPSDTTLSSLCNFIGWCASPLPPLAFHTQFGISLSDLQKKKNPTRILTEIISIHWGGWGSFISNTQSGVHGLLRLALM